MRVLFILTVLAAFWQFQNPDVISIINLQSGSHMIPSPTRNVNFYSFPEVTLLSVICGSFLSFFCFYPLQSLQNYVLLPCILERISSLFYYSLFSSSRDFKDEPKYSSKLFFLSTSYKWDILLYSESNMENLEEKKLAFDLVQYLKRILEVYVVQKMLLFLS